MWFPTVSIAWLQASCRILPSKWTKLQAESEATRSRRGSNWTMQVKMGRSRIAGLGDGAVGGLPHGDVSQADPLQNT